MLELHLPLQDPRGSRLARSMTVLAKSHHTQREPLQLLGVSGGAVLMLKRTRRYRSPSELATA